MKYFLLSSFRFNCAQDSFSICKDYLIKRSKFCFGTVCILFNFISNYCTHCLIVFKHLVYYYVLNLFTYLLLYQFIRHLVPCVYRWFNCLHDLLIHHFQWCWLLLPFVAPLKDWFMYVVSSSLNLDLSVNTMYSFMAFHNFFFRIQFCIRCRIFSSWYIMC